MGDGGLAENCNDNDVKEGETDGITFKKVCQTDHGKANNRL